MRIEGSIRVFAGALVRSVWTYLVIIGTLVTVVLIPRNWYWIVPSAICVVVVLAASRAVQIVRNAAQADAARQIAEIRSDATRQREESQKLIHNLREEIARRDEEIVRLKVRPFTKAQQDSIDAKLKELDGTARDLLRFLLDRGESDTETVRKASQVHANSLEAAVEILKARGLIIKRDDASFLPAYIVSYWRVNPQCEQILQELLYPRNESRARPDFLA